MESLIEQVDVPLRVAGIEGDALFLYAVKSGDDEVWKRRGASLVDRLQTLSDTFAQRLVEIGAYSVCLDTGRGYHFNLGRSALATNGYREEWLEGIPENVIESFAGTGNPFAMGMPAEGEYVVDVGSGAGLDGQVAANAVGLSGHVIGI